MSAAFPEVSINVTTIDATLRDYFAAQSLNGILMNYTTQKFGITEASIAEHAYKLADAMIAAREQKESVA